MTNLIDDSKAVLFPRLSHANDTVKNVNLHRTDRIRLNINIYSEFPLTYYGGGERLILMLYKHLSLHLPNVKIIENNTHIMEKRIARDTISEEVGPNLISVPFHRYGFPHFLYQDFPNLSDLTSPPKSIALIFVRRLPPKSILKVLKNSSNNFIFCLHGVAIERFHPAPLLVMIHQIVMRLQLNIFGPFINGNVYAQCLTPHIRSHLIRRGANEQNIFTIENEFNSEIAEVVANNDFFQVIFIGRMQNLTKGIKFLRKVIRKTNNKKINIKFVIIGSGPDANIMSNLRENVKFLNNANDEGKTKELQYSNLAIITSNLEPFPRVAQEFLSSGIPIISTPVSGPSFILQKDSLFGKVSTFSATQFSEDIIEYYRRWQKDKSLYLENRMEIAKRAGNIFKVENMLDSYLRMILEINSRTQKID